MRTARLLEVGGRESEAGENAKGVVGKGVCFNSDFSKRIVLLPLRLAAEPPPQLLTGTDI